MSSCVAFQRPEQRFVLGRCILAAQSKVKVFIFDVSQSGLVRREFPEYSGSSAGNMDQGRKHNSIVASG